MDTPAGRRAVAEAAYRQAKDQFEKHDREANDRAIALYRRAVDADADYPPAYAGLAAALCEAMVKYGRPRDDVEEVIALAHRAISLDAESVEGFEALAFATFARGDLRGALEAQLRVHALDPDHPDGVARIAFLYLDLGNLGEAVRWNGRALEIEPRSAYIHRNMGRLAWMFGDPGVAERWLRRAVELSPTFSSARILLVYLLLSGGHHDAGSAELDALLTQREGDPETLNFAADVALMQGDHPRAKRLYERALTLGPDSRNFYRARRVKTGLGFTLWMAGERETAQRLFNERRAIRIQEFADDLNAWGPPYELAAIQAVLGQRSEALDWLGRAVDRGWREPHLAESDPLLVGLRQKGTFSEVLDSARKTIAAAKRGTMIPAFPPSGG